MYKRSSRCDEEDEDCEGVEDREVRCGARGLGRQCGLCPFCDHKTRCFSCSWSDPSEDGFWQCSKFVSEMDKRDVLNGSITE